MDPWKEYVGAVARAEEAAGKKGKDSTEDELGLLMDKECDLLALLHEMDALGDRDDDGVRALRKIHHHELCQVRSDIKRMGALKKPLVDYVAGHGQRYLTMEDITDEWATWFKPPPKEDRPSYVPKRFIPMVKPPSPVVVVPVQPPPVNRPSLRDLGPKPSVEDEETYPQRRGLRPPLRDQPPPRGGNPFVTAGEKLQTDERDGKNKDYDRRQHGGSSGGIKGYHPMNPKVLFPKGNGEASPPRISKPFQPPDGSRPRGPQATNTGASAAPVEPDEDIDPRLKSCDPELISKIELEIVDAGDPISFDDIAGLHFAKKCVNELVIWPMARPDIFTGLRSLPKGLLLFGPPGTGKTLIGKAIATQSGATFFSISASSLTSKWIGEGEKLVRTLFAVAAVKQPSVIFIDEIDSLLTQRSSTENEASRRMKTEFLVQLDGAGTKSKDIILVVGATNRPQELDEAARRRFVKRLYIPLPSAEARLDMILRLLAKNKHRLEQADMDYIVERTRGFSGADVRALCTEAAMGPIRNCDDIRTMDAALVRPIERHDFDAALRGVRPSVSGKDLEFYLEWNTEFGSYQIEDATSDVN